MFYSINIIGRNPHRRLQTPVHAPTSHTKITTGILNRFLLIEFDGLSQNHDHEILSQNSNSLPFQSAMRRCFFGSGRRAGRIASFTFPLPRPVRDMASIDEILLELQLQTLYKRNRKNTNRTAT